MTLPTDGSDPARPQAPEVLPTVDQQAATLVQPEVTDPDEIELREALAAVKTEEAAAQTQPADPAAQPAQQPQPQASQAQARPAPTIPKARFDEMVDKANKAAQEAAYYKGVAEARAAAQQPAQPQQPQRQQATPEQQLAEIARRTDALAKQFDDGQISMTDFKRAERQLAQYEHGIREALLVAKVRPPQQPAPAPQQGNDELYLETLTADLERQHPWVAMFDQAGTKSDWTLLRERAIENLTAQGIDASGNSALGIYNRRQEMARLADELGPALVAARAQAKGITLPGQQPAAAGAQPQQRPLSPQAQARQAKLQQAANAPPNLASLVGTTGLQGFTPSQVEALTEDEFDKLPRATISKILGLSA